MYRFVAIGFSAGGIPLAKQLVSQLEPGFILPIALVAHYPENRTSNLAEVVQKVTSRKVRSVEDKMKIKAGEIYVAPASYHLMVEDDTHFSLSVDPPVNSVRPSIDVLFESAAEVFQDELIAITLSGASSDGSEGLKYVKSLNGLTVALAPEHAEFTTLSDSVKKNVDVDYMTDIEDIHALLSSVVADK